MADTPLRPIQAMTMPGIEPAPLHRSEPVFERTKPESLLVDETYQRNLSERSVALIRRIVANWEWARFKPPVVVRAPGKKFHIIDGQHTAIAAATHPGIDTIPVMVVDAPNVEDRARAFIGHNRDRITVTPNQLYIAAVAAGDPDAVTVQQVCERAGVKILRLPPGGAVFKPGESLAVSSITALVNRRGAMRARQILEVCANAKLAPVTMASIRAVEHLMTEQQFTNVVPENLTTALRGTYDELENEAKVFAAAHKVPMWKGLAVVLYRRTRRGRRSAA